MSRLVSNTDIITDSFEIAILQLNELLNSLSTEIITANSTYANTGNSTFSRIAQLWGTLGSNNIIVTNSIRGGNVNGQFANLNINSNVSVSNTTSTNLNILVSNGSSISYINPLGSYFGNGVSNSALTTNTLLLQSNSTVNSIMTSTLVQVANGSNSSNVNFDGFTSGISRLGSSSINVGANVVANSTTIKVDGSNSNTRIAYNSVTVGNSTINSVSTSNGIVISNSTSSININPNGYNYSNIYSLDVISNSNIGATLTTKVYSFPKTTYSSGKFEIQVKNSGNTQISEILLAHDGTNAYLTTYGVISSPLSANSTSSLLGTFTASINGANVELAITQTQPSSAIKIAAHLLT